MTRMPTATEPTTPADDAVPPPATDDAVPPAHPVGPPAEPTAPAARGVLDQLARDSVHLLLTFPVALASFVVLVTGLSLAAGLAVVWVGVPLGAAMLGVAVGFERLERVRLQARGTVLAPIVYAPVTGVGLRAQLRRLADPKRWAAVLHGVLALVLSCFTWSVAVAWWAGALGGLTYWFWERWLPADNQGLADLLALPITDAQLDLVLGAVLAITLPPVMRWCVGLHVGLASWLLTGSSRRALAAQVSDLTARRAAAAAAETASLRRLERDIHDGPQQRLVRLGMDLSAAERRLADDPEAARRLLAEARTQAAETLAELRALSRGIAPPILADRGLAAAVATLAARSPVPTSIDVALDDRPAPPVEAAAYFVVSEALANVAKHARAGVAVVRARSAGAGPDRVLQVEVTDDGVGGAALAKGHGLAGLADRVEGLGGLLSVTSPDGGPTVVRATLPFA